MTFSCLTKDTYSNELTWHEFFSKGKTLNDIPFDPTWTILFAKLKTDKRFTKTQECIQNIVTNDKHAKIYPLPRYVFRAFSATGADELKVVFIGQDPYFTCEYYNGKSIPLATGIAFSVAHNMKIPSSLDNIFLNMLKFGRIKKKPTSGNLWYWASQGCLMLNTTLTVEDGKKLAHKKYWEWFTDDILSYISQKYSGIIFVMWGGEAYEKNKLIDNGKHHVVVSSHPSGLSANKPFRNFPSFMDYDHFGEINKLLIKMKKSPIMWG